MQTISAKLRVAFAAIVICTLVMGLVSYSNVDTLRKVSEKASHAASLERELFSVSKAADDLHGAMLGFLVTADGDYLKQYEETSKVLFKKIDDSLALPEIFEGENEKLGQVKEVATAWKRDFLDVQRSYMSTPAKVNAAFAMEMTPPAKQYLLDIDQNLDFLKKQISDLRIDLDKQVLSSISTVRATLIVGVLVILLISVVSAVMADKT
ncbi:MAG: hypothetical protein NDJ24_09735, partial [Alphaproteobacteria bacterium]|nr:hypothetical protein [Alphaproteobacteria bacterium]